MSTDSQRSDTPGDDEQWEDLARDLLGIDITQNSEGDDVFDDSIDEELPYPESSHVDSRPASSVEEAETAEDAADEDEPGSTAPRADSETSDAKSAEEPTPAEDPYWDALQDWNWDSDSDSPRSSARQGSPGEKREVQSAKPATTESRRRPRSDSRESHGEKEVSEDIATTAQKQDFIDDSDFGAGLSSSEPTRSGSVAKREDSAETSLPDKGDAADSDADRPRRRRRRRRSGGRDRETTTAETTAAETKPPESTRQPARQPTDDDGFGAGVTTDESRENGTESTDTEDEKSTGRKRRRRRRRRRPSSDRTSPGDSGFGEGVEEKDATHSVAKSTGDSRDESESDSDEESPASYRKVPSWEEAIGSLTREKSSSSSGSGSDSSGRRRGGRRRRRR